MALVDIVVAHAHLGRRLRLLHGRLHGWLLVLLWLHHVLLARHVLHVASAASAHLIVAHWSVIAHLVATVALETLVRLLVHVALSERIVLVLHQHGHLLQQHLQVVLNLFLVGEVSPLGVLRVHLTELLESKLVLLGFVLQLADLFDLVVVNRQSLVIDCEAFFG